VLAGTLALVAVLSGPTAKSIAVVQRGATDSGRPGDMAPSETLALSHYLRSRTAGDRYEVATAYYPTVGRLIEHDDRPVVVLTSVGRRPLVTTAELAAKVRRGEVRYILIGGTCGTRPLRRVGHCPPTVRWARRHSVDVSRAAGVHESGLLFRFTRPL
jgi:hypothetical protein